MAALKPCGTVAAYMRHRRDGEPPCEACKEAKRRDSIQRRKDRGKPQQAREAKPKVFAEVEPAAGGLHTRDLDDTTKVDPPQALAGLPAQLPTGEELVELRVQRLRGNLLVVDHALFQASPREVAALSKRRQELEEAIWKVVGKSGAKKDIVDELAKARAKRQANAKARTLPAVCN